jgi:predicted ribosomally synthesized peptide with SipW-like signal peptide
MEEPKMKTKIYFSVLIVVLAALLLAGATLALFTGEAAINNNTLAAGNLELTVDSPEVRNFAIDNIYPGMEFVLSEIEITNSGSLSYFLKAVISETETVDGPGGGYLPVVIRIRAELSGSGESTAYNGTLANLLGEDLTWKENEQLLVIEPGSTVNFKLDGQFDLAAGNEYQESAWEGAITFIAVQSDGQDPVADNLNWGAVSKNPEAEPVDDKGSVDPVTPVLINAATDPARFSASRVNHGSAANLAEVEPVNEYAIWQIVIEDAALEEWISYDFGEKNTVLQYALRSTGAGDRSPRSWHLQGSDDTKNWATLDSRTEIAFSGYEEKNFSVSTTSIGSFRYYRILITESNQGTRLALSLVKFFVAD